MAPVLCCATLQAERKTGGTKEMNKRKARGREGKKKKVSEKEVQHQ